MSLPVITLAARRNSLHPWIYERMVRRPRRPPPPGTLVEVLSREGAFVGRGIYNPRSGIALRLLTQDPAESLDDAFFHARLARARALRLETLRLEAAGDAWRWVHGEADGLSGLVADRYGEVLVVEPYSAGWRGEVLEQVVAALVDLSGGARVCLRPDPQTARREHCDFEAEARRWPCPERVRFREHDLVLEADLRTGRKTGFFLDQRDNRARVGRLAAGARVLDGCCYTGGFGLAALRGGARAVTGVDLDEAALATARRNATANGLAAEYLRADVFDHLRALAGAAQDERPDLVILDPARLAALRDEVPSARRKYFDLNRLAMQALRPGGLLVSCSCTGLLDEPAFLEILRRAAAAAGVVLQVFEVAGAAPDHPWSACFPEGRYLKAVYGRVLPRGAPGSPGPGEASGATAGGPDEG